MCFVCRVVWHPNNRVRICVTNSCSKHVWTGQDNDSCVKSEWLTEQASTFKITVVAWKISKLQTWPSVTTVTNIILHPTHTSNPSTFYHHPLQHDHFWSIPNITCPQIRMDSQMKYCCLAWREGNAHQHMPTNVGYGEGIYGYVAMCLLCVLL